MGVWGVGILWGVVLVVGSVTGYGLQPYSREFLSGWKATEPNDFVVTTAANNSEGIPSYEVSVDHELVDTVIHNQLIHGSFFRVYNPIGHFHVAQPLNRCPGMIRTSVTAKSSFCHAAVNGGFFNVDTGECLGNTISYGEVVKLDGTKNVNFGLLKDGRFLVGYLRGEFVNATAPKLAEMITGVLWIVRDSQNYVNASYAFEKPDFDFVNMKAPRTAVGHDAHGHLLLLQIDGDEQAASGLDLFELADLMISKGAVNAINLDGGGSSTSFFEGKIVGKPSDRCPDHEGHCERLVSTIVCIRRIQS